ncbi:hypothetical protein GCM10022406_39530 [Hymenobacter algoricola]|uniref:Uncharacterized protein n=2 Tax=Hymenobacter algoricola TaxID=486267 RepID=A0ABP7NUY3_9BACT
MSALVGKETVSAEEATAANEELEGMGITGAALINSASYEEMSEKAGRVDAAESAQAAADKKMLELEANNTKLTNDLATETARADKNAKLPGAEATTPARQDGKSDVDEPATADANEKLVAELHAKMLGS